MHSRVCISNSTDPYYNVALEYQLMKDQDAGVGLFLWKNVPSVFVGRNQNIYEQCDLEALKKNRVRPVRRLSGGGAVYQDLGNMNYSFVMAENKNLDMAGINQFILTSLAGLGIFCECTGRNDVLCHDRKISGLAYYKEDGKIVYHGTLLYDVDLSVLSRVLVPSKLKLESKGIRSVRSRVMNLKEKYPEVTLEDIRKAFISTFCALYSVEESTVMYPQLNRKETKDLCTKLQTREWIFSEEPEFNVKLETRVDTGLVEILLHIRDGKIISSRLYTDSLEDIDCNRVREKIQGRWFDKKRVLEAVKTCLAVK